ncbi:MAG: hypothetical protein KGJ41_18135 [Rhodospirillales bacterium]|nr:hypothetical protein [Rhodospirillales bacterium]MDE2574686.1 hypothetical protein [Rhodospirillales bacterium]
MNVHLVVVRAFGAHGKGDTIADVTAIAEILAGPNALDVVRVMTKGG